jgi:hypothetical protein
MLVRIRVGPPHVPYTPKAPEVALAFASLLIPSALLAFTLALWNIAADLRWTGRFVVSTGVLSHWQAWFCAAALFLGFARLLDRYGAAEGSETLSARRQPASRFP